MSNRGRGGRLPSYFVARIIDGQTYLADVNDVESANVKDNDQNFLDTHADWDAFFLEREQERRDAIADTSNRQSRYLTDDLTDEERQQLANSMSNLAIKVDYLNRRAGHRSDFVGQVDETTRHYRAGQKEVNEAFEKAARVGADTLVGFVPVVGDLHDGFQAVTGYNLITQEKLTKGERALAAAGVLMPFASGKAIKTILDEGGDAVKKSFHKANEKFLGASDAHGRKIEKARCGTKHVCFTASTPVLVGTGGWWQNSDLAALAIDSASSRGTDPTSTGDLGNLRLYCGAALSIAGVLLVHDAAAGGGKRRRVNLPRPVSSYWRSGVHQEPQIA